MLTSLLLTLTVLSAQTMGVAQPPRDGAAGSAEERPRSRAG